LEDAAPKLEPPKRRLELLEKLEVIWLARFMKCDVLEGCVFTSSGGGEPEDGVEIGELGSGGEFISQCVSRELIEITHSNNLITRDLTRAFRVTFNLTK
jgi:hypothetical protein